MFIRKTQLKDFFTVVKKNIASFLVLAVLFGSAVAMYCGGIWVCKTERQTFISAMEDGNIAFAEYYFPYGTADSDVNEIIGGNSDLIAEGYNIAYKFCILNNERYQAKVSSITDNINKFQLVEGTLPKADGEIAVRRLWANEKGIEIGDKITLTSKNDTIDGLKSEEFLVTALVETARYPGTYENMYGMSPSDGLPINCAMFVAKDAFDLNLSNGYSNIALLSLSQNKADIFDEEYKNIESNILKEIEGNAEAIYQKGYNKTVFMYNQIPIEMRGEAPVDYGYYITLKSENRMVVMYDIIENIFSNVQTSLTSLFVLVSVLVGYAVISRMVHDHIKLIGMKNANGMNKKEIFSLYFAFCLSSLIIGVLTFGIGISYLYEFVIRYSLSAVFTVPHEILASDWAPFIKMSIILAAFVSVVVFISVQKIMKMNVTDQLAGEVTIAGKKRFYEKFRIWKKLPLLTRTIINNFFNDKRRVIGTILGIVGSTTIIIASFTFSNLVLNSFDAQFEEYFHFDTLVRFMPGEQGETESEEVFEKLGYDYTQTFVNSYYFESDDGKQVVGSFFVYYDEESFRKLFALKTQNGEELKDGVLFSFAIEKAYDVSEGSSIKVKSFSGENTTVKIDGFFVDYLFEVTCVCSIDKFEELFGYRPLANSYFVNSNGNVELLNRELLKNETSISNMNYVETSENAFHLIKLVMIAMKALFLSVAIGMALIVLWNLTNVFILEKKRDLITLMINGYDVSFAKKYIYSDTILLTVIGITLGTVIGELFGNYTAASFSAASCRYMSGIDLSGILYGIIIATAITLIINFIALKKIDKFNLSDLNM